MKGYILEYKYEGYPDWSSIKFRTRNHRDAMDITHDFIEILPYKVDWNLKRCSAIGRFLHTIFTFGDTEPCTDSGTLLSFMLCDYSISSSGKSKHEHNLLKKINEMRYSMWGPEEPSARERLELERLCIEESNH